MELTQISEHDADLAQRQNEMRIFREKRIIVISQNHGFFKRSQPKSARAFDKTNNQNTCAFKSQINFVVPFDG